MIVPGQFYHHYKGGRKARVVLVGKDSRHWSPMVGYVHEDETFLERKAYYALNPEYKQDGKPYQFSPSFWVTKNLLGDWIFEPKREKIPTDTLLYARTIANFTEDLGDGVKRFWLVE